MDIQLSKSSFQLDVSGIAGFFGGEEAFAAMSSIHLVRGRRFLGWYNSPGSFFVAKKYGVLARSRIWDGLYPGANDDPARVLQLDSKTGPRYVGLHSGTRLQATGHLAYLFEQLCSRERENDARKRRQDEEVVHAGPEDVEQGNGNGTAVDEEEDPQSELVLTIAHLGEIPEPEKAEDHKKFGKSKKYNKIRRRDSTIPVPEHSVSPFNFSPLIAISASFAACACCGANRDWFCFAMILLGILCNGVSCLVIGSGVLRIKVADPSPYSPPGDSILDGKEEFILLMGSERSVRTLTKGKFYLHYASETKYHDIGWSAAALTRQFFLQLFLIPQGTLFGQIMFLSSLAISWLHNAYLASLDSEALQTGILRNLVLHKLERIPFKKRTAIVVFTLVYAKPGKVRNFLEEMIPNDTDAWKLVKDMIEEAIKRGEDPRKYAEGNKSLDIDALRGNDSGLVWDMLEQASIGFTEAQKHRHDDFMDHA